MTFSVPGYEVGELLGAGSIAQVRVGRRRTDGQRVALKRIAYESADAMRSARAEATLLGALSHPYLIQFHEFVVSRDGLVLVMELAEGGSLADLLRRRQSLTPAEVAAALSPIALALSYAHEEGALHLDVSAANVLFTAEGRSKLADLGISRLRPAPAADCVQGLVSIGTPAYLDPFVAAGGIAGTGSDVFSIAALALQALTGLGPWQLNRDDPVETVLAAARSGVPPIELAERLRGCPPAMADTLRRALDRDPRVRGTVAEFALDLRASVTDGEVVLQAGRLPDLPGRHSAEHLAGCAVGSDSLPETAGRPAFVRPHTTTANRFPQAVPLDLTHLSRPMVRSQVSPAAPVGSRFALWRRVKLFTHRVRGGSVRRAAIIGAVAAVAAAVAVGGWVLATGWTSENAPGSAGPDSTLAPVAKAGISGQPNATGAAGTAVAGTGVADTSASGTASVAATAPMSSEQWALAELRALDALRSRAFADRDPAALRQVYHSMVLLEQDQTQLRDRVAADCRLLGLATNYSQPRVWQRSDTTVELTVLAAQPSARLLCAGGASTATAAVSATPIRLTLTADAAGRFAIAAQHIG